MPVYIQYYHSPVGELMLGDHNGKLCLCDWKYRRMRPQIDKRICRETQTQYKEAPSDITQEAAQQLEAYFSGERTVFDIPLLPTGTDFQQKVWKCLKSIPYGTTVSYGHLAKMVGTYVETQHFASHNVVAPHAPPHPRAVASANGANAISLFIPCHRVIGADGALTGYAGGLSAKKKLLQLEQSQHDPLAGLRGQKT